MALIAQTDVGGAIGSVKLVWTEGFSEGAAGTLVYQPNELQFLVLRNVDAAAPTTVTIKGALAPAVYAVPGTGQTIDLSAGFAVTIPFGESRHVCLRQIQRYLVGDITVTASGDPSNVDAALFI